MGPRTSNATTEFILVGLSDDRETQILLFVVILLIYIFTLVGNAGIIMLIQVNSHLQTPMYFFLMHLSGLEIFYVNTTLPQILAHLLAGHARLSILRCAIQTHATLALAAAESLLLGVMSYDRYLAICHPLVYATLMGRERQFQLASSCWVVGILIATIGVSLTFSHSFCRTCCVRHFICEIPMVLRLACDDIFITKIIIFMVATMVLFGSFSVILTSYGLIMLSLFQMRSATGLRKALSTCGSHLAVVIMFYSIATVVYLIPRPEASSDNDKQIAVFYILVTPLLNPIIYTLRNKDVHDAVAKMVRKSDFELKG